MGSGGHGGTFLLGDSLMSRYFSAAKRRQRKDADEKRAALMRELDDIFLDSELRTIVAVEEAWDRLRERLYAEDLAIGRSDLHLEENRK